MEETNPLKSDGQLKMLLGKLDRVNKYNSFQRWKGKFLARLEEFLYDKGMEPADKACTDIEALLAKLIGKTTKVLDFIEKGQLSEEKKTVKASLALNEMCKTLQETRDQIEDLVPSLKSAEKRKGFTKFHLGAALIRQGFHQFVSMKAVEDAVQEIGQKLETLADKQQLDLFYYYKVQVKRFCDVMADLDLYTVMMKCVQFANPPDEEESEDPDYINISVKTPDGTMLKMEVDPKETVGGIKEAAESGAGIPAGKQVLKLQDQELEDSKTMEDLGIEDGAVFEVEKRKIPIAVNAPDEKTIELVVDPDIYVTDLKLQLEPQSGIPAKMQSLKKNGEELEDPTKSLDDLGIQAGSVLDLEPKTFKVNVNMPDNSTLQLDVSPSDNAEAIKKQIEAVSGMVPARQVLKHDGEELPTGVPAKEMGLKEGSTIDVDVFKIPITVRNWDGSEIPLQVEPIAPLGTIKNELEPLTGIPTTNQILSLDGTELNKDTESIADNGIAAGTILDLEPKSISVTITTPDGKKTELDLALSDTDADIKKKIEEKTGLAVPRQVVKHNGEDLPGNGTTVKEMGIKEGSALDVQLFTIPVTVKNWDGTEIPIRVEPTQDILSVKQMVEPESGIRVDNRVLSHADSILSDDSTIQKNGIVADAVLDLEPQTINVKVDVTDGENVEIDIPLSHTEEDIKKEIEKKTGIAASQQLVNHGGEELPSGTSARDMGLKEGSQLQVDVRKIPIIVKSWDGTEIPLEVKPSQDLASIRKQIEAESGIPASNQLLSLNEKELEDEKTVEGNGIQSGDEIALEPRTINVNIDMPDGEKIAVDIPLSASVDDIKKKVEEKTGMAAPRQVVKYEGNEIPSGRTARDIGLKEGSCLKVEVLKVPVKVNVWDGSTFDIMVDPTEDMLEVKKLAEPESGIPVGNQVLSLGGQVLEDDSKSAGSYGIQAGTILDLEPKVIKINAKMPNGESHQVEIGPSDDCSTIKKKIEAQTGMEVPRQVLKFGGKEIPEKSTAKELALREGSTIDVEVFKIPVTVNNWDGRKFEIMVDPTDKLVEIKKQLEPESNIPVKNQVLSMMEHELTDEEKRANAYGIQAGSILELEPFFLAINVEMPDGSRRKLEVKAGSTGDDIKEKLASDTGIAAIRQVLKFEEKEMLANSTVKGMGMQDGSTIQCSLFKIPITVRTWDERTIPINVEPVETLGGMKTMLEGESGLPAKRQVIKFIEQELEDNKKTISSYGIKKGSVVDLEPKDDPIVFVDVKCGTLFGVDRDDVIEKGILTPNQGNPLEFNESEKNSSFGKDKILKSMLDSPNLGVKPQIVVEKVEVEDYDLQEAEEVKNKWGVKLKKTQKGRRGEEFIFVDVKTEAYGLLDRQKCIEMKFITPKGHGKDETLEEAENNQQIYDKYVNSIRVIFGVKTAS